MRLLNSQLFQESGAAAPAPLSPSGMVKIGDSFVPRFPGQLSDVGIDPDVVSGLALKHAYTVPKFSTEWMIEKLCLPLPVVTHLLEGLRDDRMVEVVGHDGPFGFNYAATNRGRDLAKRLVEISGYVGPTPVSLEAYIASLDFQFQQLPPVEPERVRDSIAEMVLPEHITEVGGLAVMSRRSLFLHGPPGNGKTSIGHLLHNAATGELWIPYAIGVGNEIIRVFDPECHEQSETTNGKVDLRVDARWLKVRRPFVVVGGELTMEALDLVHDSSRGYYEAPLHMKANGGTFLLDDFGCQRVPPHDLLNRWIHPLERGVDFLTLQSGQQIQVPFRQMLIVSTNLDPEKMMSAAFLRRMGYRLHIPNPDSDAYKQIFKNYALSCNVEFYPDVLDDLLKRYEEEKRPLRSCEPRDLIERARDICQFRGVELTLSREVLNFAWNGYFGLDARDVRTV